MPVHPRLSLSLSLSLFPSPAPRRPYMWAARATAVLAVAALAGRGADAADGPCTRAYWSGAVPTVEGADKPSSLRGGAAGRTPEGALVAVHVDASNAHRPTASFFNEHQSAWTSHQAFSGDVRCEGAAVGANAAPQLGDGAGGDGRLGRVGEVVSLSWDRFGLRVVRLLNNEFGRCSFGRSFI